MALVHRAKVTHYFSPSPRQLSTFFRSVTSLYAEQCLTDLIVVAGGVDANDADNEDAAANTSTSSYEQFGAHQVRISNYHHRLEYSV